MIVFKTVFVEKPHIYKIFTFWLSKTVFGDLRQRCIIKNYFFSSAFFFADIFVIHYIWSWWWWHFFLSWSLLSTKVFSSLLKWLTYACSTNVSLTFWLWTPQTTKCFQPTCLTNFPFNLNEQPHFFVLVLLQTNLSLSCLYFPSFSLPTTT